MAYTQHAEYRVEKFSHFEVAKKPQTPLNTAAAVHCILAMECGFTVRCY